MRCVEIDQRTPAIFNHFGYFGFAGLQRREPILIGRYNRLRLCCHDVIHQLLNLRFKARHLGSEVRAMPSSLSRSTAWCTGSQSDVLPMTMPTTGFMQAG